MSPSKRNRKAGSAKKRSRPSSKARGNNLVRQRLNQARTTSSTKNDKSHHIHDYMQDIETTQINQTFAERYCADWVTGVRDAHDQDIADEHDHDDEDDAEPHEHDGHDSDDDHDGDDEQDDNTDEDDVEDYEDRMSEIVRQNDLMPFNAHGQLDWNEDRSTVLESEVDDVLGEEASETSSSDGEFDDVPIGEESDSEPLEICPCPDGDCEQCQAAVVQDAAVENPATSGPWGWETD